MANKFVWLKRFTRVDDNIVAQIAGRDYFSIVGYSELPIHAIEYNLAKLDAYETGTLWQSGN